MATLMSSSETFACDRENPLATYRDLPKGRMLSASCLSMHDFEHLEMNLKSNPIEFFTCAEYNLTVKC
jgi:hypothetical protein